MQLSFCKFTYLPLPPVASPRRTAADAATIAPADSSDLRPPPKTTPKRRRRKRLDCARTLARYEARVRGTPSLVAALPELEGAYLSTFEVFSTESAPRDTHSNNAFVLMAIAREHGVRVKAVTSECKERGVYRAALLPGDSRKTAVIVYVGSYNYFTNHHETKWAVRPEDRVYHPLQ